MTTISNSNHSAVPTCVPDNATGDRRPLGEFQAVEPRPSNGTELAGPHGDSNGEGRSRRSIGRLTALVLVTGVVAVAAFMYDPRNLFDDEPARAPEQRDSVLAVTTDLEETYDADGQLRFERTQPIAAVGSAGVLTDVVEADTAVGRGDVLWRVVDEPVVVLLGEIPASRGLTSGDTGPDVRQLKENLVLMGYDPDGTVTVDEEYTDYTAAMVERWQTDIGAIVTGSVADGAIVFLPGTSRTGAVMFAVGDTIAADNIVLEVSALERVIKFTLVASDLGELGIGDVVTVQLPDRSTLEATVVAATPRSDGDLDVVARPTAPVDYPVDIAPVTVRWQVSLGSSVLTVPAGALIRTDDGNYNVELRSANGTEKLVPVEVGRVSGVNVEIVSGVSEGDEVIAP